MSAGMLLTLRTLRALTRPYLTTIHVRDGGLQNIFKEGQ